MSVDGTWPTCDLGQKTSALRAKAAIHYKKVQWPLWAVRVSTKYVAESLNSPVIVTVSQHWD